MSNYPLGEVIAERELTFVRNDGGEEKVVVRIGKPYRTSEQEPWFCPYEIAGEIKKKNMTMAGVDSAQALILAFKVIPAELDHWAKKQNGWFSFGGGPNAGLPTISEP